MAPWNKGQRYTVEDRVDAHGGHSEGERVGGKVLVTYHGRNAHGHHMWLWRSDCCAAIHGPSTLSHLRRSTRCLTCSRQREHNGRWKGHEDLTGVWLTQVQGDAVKRHLAWEVTAIELWELWLAQGGRCVYTGRQLAHGVDASLDRRDNRLGYVPGNVQWVHRDVNRMKSDLAESYFLALCLDIAQHAS